MTASSEVAATTVDKTGASDAEFQALLTRDGDEWTVDRVTAAIKAQRDALCNVCWRPPATQADWENIPEGEGSHLCWEPNECGWPDFGGSADVVFARAAIDALKGPAL